MGVFARQIDFYPEGLKMASEEIPENQLRSDIARAMDRTQVAPVVEGGLPGVDSTKPAAAWLKEVTAAKQYLSKFHDKGIKINERFLDIREADDESDSKLNLFTTNTNILISTLYAKFPTPLVTRAHEDEKDDVGRTAAQILERNLKVEDRDSFDIAMKHIVQDRLVPGLGQLWFRYEPTIVSEPNPEYVPPSAPDAGAIDSQPIPGDGQMPPPATEAGQMGLPGVQPAPQAPPQPEMLDRLVNEEVATDYVHWQDFIWSPCRIWEECRWVGRKAKMTKADVEKRFGKGIAEALKYTKGNVGDAGSSQNNSGDNADAVVMYATVIEIWCKRSRMVYWVSEGFPNCLDVKPDPFKLPKFWPCPKPMMALLGTSSTVPRADYVMVQDQYKELDSINNRIAYLQRAVKVVGIYDKTNKDLSRILTEGMDNMMVAADNFGQFAAQGGFKGMVDWLPLQDITNAIEKLRQYRADLISQIYELTGISDIMRGSTKASETLGAQQLKAQYGSVRLQFLQMEVASFVEEALDIKARIMIQRFQPDTLVKRSNLEMTVDAELIAPAMQLLKSPLWQFRVIIHADSMAVPEFNAERDARLQYLRAIAEFMTAMAPMVEQNPGAAPFLLEMMQWGAAGFRVGRSIEGTLDKAIAAANAALKAKAEAGPPPPSPAETSKIKLDAATAMLRTAEAVGQAIENKYAKENPEEVFGKPDPAPAPPTVQ